LLLPQISHSIRNQEHQLLELEPLTGLHGFLVKAHGLSFLQVEEMQSTLSLGFMGSKDGLFGIKVSEAEGLRVLAEVSCPLGAWR
jgi:hypothetical protein